MRDSFTRFLAIAAKEFRQLSRDRLSFGMIVMVPLMQLILFGYAINLDVRNLTGGVVDYANSALSRQLIADVVATQVFALGTQPGSVEELATLLQRGELSIGLVVPRDFEERVAHGRTPYVQVMVDAVDPVVLGAAKGLNNMPFTSRPALTPPPGTGAPIEILPLYNPERRSAVFIVPGLVGVILTMTMVLFTAVAIVRERERGNLEFLITTPVQRLELMAGKIVPYVCIGLVQVTLILSLGVGLFRMPVQGRLPDLYLCALVFIGAALSLGLVISTLATTQFQAFQLTFFVFLPQMLLSGFMFPFSGMPALARGIAELLPLTHFVRLSRGILLRGATAGQLWADIWPLLLFMTVMLTLAVLRFRKTLD